MMIGVRCADPKRAASVTARAYQYGLIIERAGPDDEVIKCMMPLTTTVGELDEGLDILERAIAEEFGGRTVRSAEGCLIEMNRLAASEWRPTSFFEPALTKTHRGWGETQCPGLLRLPVLSNHGWINRHFVRMSRSSTHGMTTLFAGGRANACSTCSSSAVMRLHAGNGPRDAVITEEATYAFATSTTARTRWRAF